MNDTLLNQAQSIVSRFAPGQSDAERCCAERGLRALALRSSARAIGAATVAIVFEGIAMIKGVLHAEAQREEIEDGNSPVLR
jgi:cystathionine beta-lyase/cystathionine gamma-synthase